MTNPLFLVALAMVAGTVFMVAVIVFAVAVYLRLRSPSAGPSLVASVVASSPAAAHPVVAAIDHFEAAGRVVAAKMLTDAAAAKVAAGHCLTFAGATAPESQPATPPAPPASS